jgi:23S rRNA (cytidine1920-2'-O)/16S rRNA (cytidine1409-2'-O)-methyltransferase
VPRRRLDVELVRRGLASSRAEAQAVVAEGRVTVAGNPATKASSLVADDAPVDVIGPARRYVSRGGEKLRSGLDRFAVDPRDRHCLDAGASTGGFTDCLLQAGAARVAAIDVGYGQLAWKIRNDPRVIVMERTNVRNLEPADVPFAPDLVVADLSFISLRAALPALVTVSDTGAGFVVLVKPQFEAGRADVPKGVVRDPAVRRRVLRDVCAASAAWGSTGRGSRVVGVVDSGLPGPKGNREFLVHLLDSPEPTVADDLDRWIDDAVG